MTITITLPDDLERSIRETVDSGRFATIDEAMAEAARRLLDADDATDDGPIGALRDAADELDAVVADVYRARRVEAWRDLLRG